MKVTLNGNDMEFAEGGYKYVFMKPYHRFVEDTFDKGHGSRLHIEIYDNGVEIRTTISKTEVATVINRDIAIDTINHKVYILEEGNKVKKNEDGSIEVE